MFEPAFLFIGCGDATLRHSRTLDSVAPGCLRFYASRASEKARSFSESYGGSGWFNSYESGMADGRIDAVVIATPTFSHLELTMAALRAGKHVIVEKPAFMNLAEMDAVQALALTRNRKVMVAENYYYKPSAFILRDLLADEAIGSVRLAWINAMKWQRTAGWRGDPALSGGGPLFEGGVHWINLLANLGMRVVACETDACGGDSTTITRVRYDNGAVAVLAYSWEMKSKLNGIRISKIFGTAGAITFESNGLFIRVKGRRNRLFLPNVRDITGTRAMWRDFIAALKSDREPEFTWTKARTDIALLTRDSHLAPTLQSA